MSRFEEVRKYLGRITGVWGWCGRNCAMEGWRCWAKQRMPKDGGSIICYDTEVV